MVLVFWMLWDHQMNPENAFLCVYIPLSGLWCVCVFSFS